MNIRILNESDAILYQELRLRALKINPEAFGSTYEREASFTPEAVKDRIKPSEDKFVLGAFEEGKRLIGMAVFVRERSLKTAHKGNVYGMFIAPEARSKGVGKLLLIELIRMAKKCPGLEQINLTVVSINETAKKLYKSVGFQVYGLERNALKFNGQYFDEDLMVLNIDCFS
ncbi:GNAT family N-acetyltransferase [Heyndrickxia acidicola]|uniref:GNAT family N-acetyltransferase n=1 Tax=Heyndrickxia acidicola TaxID=209389 RepID=A0ABU6MAF0_9BACI|nr:GNAT family N-acetyltransferase [Heyndrickxia acidicola]MED1201623.1 GNAT family N-acetyltransferase [Heyndrickxia acidicola]